MEPVFTVDCARYVANPFVLVHVAAARARQLNRGATPRLNEKIASTAELALREIASGAFDEDELRALLPASHQPQAPDRIDVIDETSFIRSGGAGASEPLALEADPN